MWQLVFTSTLLGTALVTALPAAQQGNSGDLTSLIAEAFPTTTTPQSVPQIGGDIDLTSIIKNLFDNATIPSTTTGSDGLILGSQNQQPQKPSDCDCVPYYQCNDGRILQTGIGIIDIRSGFADNNKQFQG